MIARTSAGRRLLTMFETEARPNGERWPRAFDARLAERIVEDFIPSIEEEASEAAGPTIRMGARVYFSWSGGDASFGRVTGIGGSSAEPGIYTVTVKRAPDGPPVPRWARRDLAIGDVRSLGWAIGEALEGHLRAHVQACRFVSSDCAECVAAAAAGIEKVGE